ncbi:MAG: transglutaminase family protein [Hydrocarboniphaga sp.]|uniref:transglutaminase family protein n=1 Tax=Hydrocarboniphaga sp. TaxID=2033016 RepID=UPI002617331E|nr:transglutaminase family protein [Hydrocarboniphaga sp.]MDB5968216.1 transglutaminase family protein [Hydrocarboniphaga sp.]
MQLTIKHCTRYQYSRAIMLQPHRLIVTPRDSGELLTVRRSLECVPPADLTWSADVFGNLIATASFAEPTSELTIISEAVVEHTAPEWPIFAISPDAHRYPFAYSLDDVVDLGALAQPDWLTPGGQRVGAWARRFVLALQTDSLSLLKDLNSGVLRDVRYRVRDEEGTQSPASTLELGSGSCRDIAALFIEAARHLGFGARAVSGYLFDPDQKDEDAGATHAWAEAYLPGAGWIAFDPSNQRVGGSQLVPVAFARFNRQIMPVTGGYIGTPEDFEQMDVAVRVRSSAR